MHIYKYIFDKPLIFKIIKENTSEKKAPELLRPLEDISVTEGRNIRFRCKIAAYPQPLVIWYKDGKKIRPTERKKIGQLLIRCSFKFTTVCIYWYLFTLLYYYCLIQ